MIRGELTNLRAIERPDAAALFRWLNDPDVMRHWGAGEAVVSRSAVETDIEKWLHQEQSLGHPAAFLIESLEGDPIGFAVLTQDRRQDRSVELSLLIGEPSRWGAGLGTDALEALVDACFCQWSMHRISARSEAFNVRAHRWLRRAGFTQEGVLRDASFFDAQFHDQLLFGLLESDRAGTK